MKTAFLCGFCSILAALISGSLVHRHHISNPDYDRDRKYNEALSRTFEFPSGYTFQLKDIRIKTFSETSPWTRIIGVASQPDIPMMVDLVDGTGESILARGPTSHRVPAGEATDYCFETHIGLWTKVPNLKLVATIFPNDKTRVQVIEHSIPNPIYFHQLLDLDGGADSTTLAVRTRKPFVKD